VSASTPAAKVFTNKLSQVPLTCPSCHTTTLVNMGKYTGTESTFKARCGCGCVFDIPGVVKEGRKYYRKKTSLPGSYFRTDKDVIGVIRIKDLSFSGIGFKTDKDHEIEVGDVLGVKFVLDAASKAELRHTVVVKRVRGNIIGAEFCDAQVYDMDLIHYLMLS
jgi:hypothetical protein